MEDDKINAPYIDPNAGITLRTDSLKLNVTDWLYDLGDAAITTDLVEVQFKNTRKAYFVNSNFLKIEKGDVVAVESSPGHDIGVVTLTGELVWKQIRKNNIDPSRYEFRRVYRKAKQVDVEKWEQAKSREHATMIRSREIAADLRLDMKIGDVEFQGDGNKAIFYYIAEDRVDFRTLIKVLADEFKVRIEMRQIGARQEAGRIGGIGPCGRELCCASWMTRFVSVSTTSARYQELSLNPQKLAGMCAKLKCCMNYEIDAYAEAQNNLPDRSVPLYTEKFTYYHSKTDVFREMITYVTRPGTSENLVSIHADKVREIQAMNRKGIRPFKLEDVMPAPVVVPEMTYENVVGQDDLTRFDKRNRPNNKNKNRKVANQRGGNDRGGNERGSNEKPQMQNNAGAPAGQRNNNLRHNNQRREAKPGGQVNQNPAPNNSEGKRRLNFSPKNKNGNEPQNNEAN